MRKIQKINYITIHNNNNNCYKYNHLIYKNCINNNINGNNNNNNNNITNIKYRYL